MMKYLKPLIILLMIAVSLVACNGSKDPATILTSTTWGIDVEATISKIKTLTPEKLKELFSNDEEEKEVMAKMAKVRFIFKKEGIVKSTDGNRSNTGTWEISEDGKTLTFVSKKGVDPSIFTIQSMSANKIVMIEEDARKSRYKPFVYSVLKAVD